MVISQFWQQPWQLACHHSIPSGGDVSRWQQTWQLGCHHPMQGRKFLPYSKVSAKNHECTRRAGLEFLANYLTQNDPLPGWEGSLETATTSKNTDYPKLGQVMSIESYADSVFGHDKPDITMVSHVRQDAEAGRSHKWPL